jgi:hypothetical protein
MPKAILEFNLDDFDDRVAHLRAIKSLDLALALWDMDQYLRAEYKYGEPTHEVYEALETARKKLFEIMSEHNVSLDELIY